MNNNDKTVVGIGYKIFGTEQPAAVKPSTTYQVEIEDGGDMVEALNAQDSDRMLGFSMCGQ